MKHATQTSARPQSKRPEPGPSTRGNGGQRHREPAPQSSRRNTGGRNPGDTACPESGRRGGRAQPSRTGNLPQCARTASPARRHRRFCTGQEPVPGRRLPPGDPPQLRRRADSSRGRPGEAALTPAETDEKGNERRRFYDEDTPSGTSGEPRRSRIGARESSGPREPPQRQTAQGGDSSGLCAPRTPRRSRARGGALPGTNPRTRGHLARDRGATHTQRGKAALHQRALGERTDTREGVVWAAARHRAPT